MSAAASVAVLKAQSRTLARPRGISGTMIIHRGFTPLAARCFLPPVTTVPKLRGPGQGQGILAGSLNSATHTATQRGTITIQRLIQHPLHDIIAGLRVSHARSSAVMYRITCQYSTDPSALKYNGRPNTDARKSVKQTWFSWVE